MSLCHLNVQPSRAFCNYPKTWKWHGHKSRLYAGYSSIFHHMVFSWSCTHWATWWWALLCSMIMLSVSLPRRLFFILVHSFQSVWQEHCVQWLCHVIWSSEEGILQCPCSPVRMIHHQIYHFWAVLQCCLCQKVAQLTVLSYSAAVVQLYMPLRMVKECNIS
jgi:hypothetical protein